MSSANGLGFGIEHIVVLMFENRSFDNMLGGLYPYHSKIGNYEFEGLPPGAANEDSSGKSFPVWTESPPYTDSLLTVIPDPDPGERFQNVNFQLYGHGFDPSTAYSTLGVAPMSGFVKDYILPGPTDWIKSDILGMPWPKLPRGKGTATAEHIMHYFSPELTPVFSALAKQYAVCDQWFASVASQTFPNRMFAHAASSDGGLDDVEILLKHVIEGYKINNIFETLDNQLGKGDQQNWRIYYDDKNDSYSISELLFNYVKKNKDNLSDISKFAADVKDGLPPYTFIEPNYGHKISTPQGDPVNSYHPPFNVLDGEELLWSVYNTLQTENPEAWQKTLFLVTFDEHGGCYDHFSPPGVPAPAGGQIANAPFDRYGVRVPTLVISPNVQAGSLFRAQSANGQFLDHTSILRTVFDCFLGDDVSINGRDKNAPSFAAAMTSSCINAGLAEKPVFPDIPMQANGSKDDHASGVNHLSQMWQMTQK
jgi:phospholipase C